MKEGVGRALSRAIGRDDVLSRIKPREGGISVLMNGKRRRILQHLMENPLTHLRELARKTGIPVGTADWHLGILESAGLVSAYEGRNRRCYYPSAWIDKEDIACLCVLQDQPSKAVFLLVKRNRGLSQTDIAERLGKYQQYVQPHIAQLQECGFLQAKQKGKRKIYSIGDATSKLEEKYQKKSGAYLKNVLQTLEMDGLNPKVQGKSKVLMNVRMDDGQNEFFLRVRANPIKAILEE